MQQPLRVVKLLGEESAALGQSTVLQGEQAEKTGASEDHGEEVQAEAHRVQAHGYDEGHEGHVN